MAHHLIHPQLSQTLRAIGHRIGAWAIPDDEAPTLILEQPVDMAAARPLHRIHTPACDELATSTFTDVVHAVLMVLCMLIFTGLVIAGSTDATWADALRVLATLAWA